MHFLKVISSMNLSSMFIIKAQACVYKPCIILGEGYNFSTILLAFYIKLNVIKKSLAVPLISVAHYILWIFITFSQDSLVEALVTT